MVDFLGPGAYGALRPTSLRPAVIPANGSSDPLTWYKDCTSPANEDGTSFQAASFNAMLAQMRGIVSAAGITADNLDDLLLARAIRAQRMNWASPGGTANAITLTPSPAFASAADLVGVPLRFVVAATNTGAVTLSVNGISAALEKVDGTAFASGGLPSGALIEAIYDGTRFVTLFGSTPAGGAGSTAWVDITGKPLTFPPSAHEHPISDLLSSSVSGQVPRSNGTGNDPTWDDVENLTKKGFVQVVSKTTTTRALLTGYGNPGLTLDTVSITKKFADSLLIVMASPSLHLIGDANAASTSYIRAACGAVSASLTHYLLLNNAGQNVSPLQTAIFALAGLAGGSQTVTFTLGQDQAAPVSIAVNPTTAADGAAYRSDHSSLYLAMELRNV